MLKAVPLQRLRPPATAPTGAALPIGILLLVLFAHMPLGLLLKKVPGTSTYHALATMAVGVAIAFKCRTPVTIAYLAAYVAGIEVVWRMTKAKTFTEWGKLTISVFVLIAVLRFSRMKRTWLPVIYFALLIPSTLMIFPTLAFEDFKESLTSTLSGPFALMACMYYFSGIKLNSAHLLRILLALLIPIMAVSAIVAFTTVTATDLDFSRNVRNLTNSTASGGFGPNQVSGTLGLGILAAFMIMMHEQTPARFKPVFFSIMAGLAAQAALTFSRTGIYLATGSIIAACFFYLGDSRMRPRIVFFLTALIVVVVIIFPLLNSFTDGALMDRFRNINTTGRDTILFCDLIAFIRNPILGLGLDQGLEFRAQWLGIAVVSHLEWTRMLAEHGVFGLIGLLILMFMGWRGFASAETLRARAAVTCIIMYTILYTSSSGMRLAIPSFTFGLACASWKFGLPSRRVRPRIQPRSQLTTSPARGAIRPPTPNAKL